MSIEDKLFYTQEEADWLAAQPKVWRTDYIAPGYVPLEQDVAVEQKVEAPAVVVHMGRKAMREGPEEEDEAA